MKILIINGPNLNLLGKRNTSVYGNQSFEDFFQAKIAPLKGVEINHVQSNVEGELVNFLHETDADAIIINAGAYTHTSVAIRDAIEAIQKPVVEVHISNITKRESFRHESLISPVVVGCIFGFGLDSYLLAIHYLMNK
jgi:3-dehydroquinate dehydratase-2